MDAKPDCHALLWRCSRCHCERRAPVFRPHGTRTKRRDACGARPIQDLRAIGIEGGELEMAVSVEHGGRFLKKTAAISSPHGRDGACHPPFTKVKKPVVMAGM